MVWNPLCVSMTETFPVRFPEVTLNQNLKCEQEKHRKKEYPTTV